MNLDCRQVNRHELTCSFPAASLPMMSLTVHRLPRPGLYAGTTLGRTRPSRTNSRASTIFLRADSRSDNTKSLCN